MAESTAVAAESDRPRSRRGRGLAVAIAGLGLIAAAIAGPAGPASAAATKWTPPQQLQYAAVGDSFAAGTGARPYADKACSRSALAYPKLLTLDLRIKLAAFPACSGADIPATLAQVNTLPSGLGAISVGVGGQDVGFVAVMYSCFVVPDPAVCPALIAAGAAGAQTPEFAAGIDAVILAAKAKAPKVVLTGYPLLFHENGAGVNPKYQYADEVNDATVILNDALEARALANGIVFVDVEDDFAGHGIGSSRPWINDFFALLPTDGFHPNAFGYAAYAKAVRPSLAP
ncbi:SGNH/GDSL hydrolase family protein [Agromyces seonyuensis]|uniref:SGNH hydrolase-type esterase domain-containing protein n=1 Tax=Agromyces seonyuensis TaxID=2662446 RepID=A0A6I4NXS7_9MICO|nr:SGNH/GDSL hydrolase family protein [Agromyces seonyuensis]MWB99116.1 hypothetical protein [Agromyces seonyuensis]